MEYNQNVFSSAYFILRAFLYHIVAYREIHKVIDSLPGDKEFWVYSSDAHIQMAVMHWCKVFGSRNEKTHCNKVVAHFNDAEGMKSFTTYFIQKITIDMEEWSTYIVDMKKFRDEYVAHGQVKNYDFPVPNFDLALKAAYSYDVWTRELMKPDINENILLEKQRTIWSKEIQDTLCILIRCE